MNTNLILKNKYRYIEEQSRILIKDYSQLTYVEDSSEVVEGGMFIWSEISPEAQQFRKVLIDNYLRLAAVDRSLLEECGSPYLGQYEHSFNLILSYIKQDTLLWESSIEEVLETVQKELALMYVIVAPFAEE